MPEPRPARRLAGIAPFHVMAILARARELEAAGRRIIHMEIGEPPFATPEPVIRAAHAALDRGATRYTPALGLPALREAIAADYAARFAATVAPERIVVTPGASGALQLALAAIVDPGDGVLMADPGYPCNRHFVRLLDGVPRLVPVGPATGYQLTAGLIAEHWDARCRAVLLASPSNPTGTLVPPDELARIVATVERLGGLLIVDEIYQGLVYDGPARSVLAQSDAAFVVNSFSKFFCMTGWRLGWLVCPPGWTEAVDRLAQNLFLAAPTLSQHAALAVFEPESLAILEGYRRTLGARRDRLLAALAGSGLAVGSRPQGAFYLYADCSALTDDSEAFCRELLEATGVALTPGCDFGEHRAREHVRLAYTASDDELLEAVERIAGFSRQGV